VLILILVTLGAILIAIVNPGEVKRLMFHATHQAIVFKLKHIDPVNQFAGNHSLESQAFSIMLSLNKINWNTIEKMRQSVDGFQDIFSFPSDVSTEDVLIRRDNGEEMFARWMTPRNVKSHSPVILFLHGGGYVSGSVKSHGAFVAEFAKRSNARGLFIDYSLGPEKPLPAGVEDALLAYRWLLAQHIPAKNIFIAGDSAGGGLTVLAAIAIRDQKVERPAGLILISPWMDMAREGPSYKNNLLTDVLVDPATLPVVFALGSNDPKLCKNPQLSPLYASFAGLSPTIVQYGTFECLASDSIIFADKAKKEGVDVILEAWSGQQHVFPLFFPFFEEADQALNRLADFINKVFQS